MNKIRIRILVFLLLLFPCSGVLDAHSREPDRGPPGDWVQVRPLPTSPDIDPATLIGGFHYLLFDLQVHIPDQQMFAHIAFQVVNSDGVQNMSDIDMNFDPSYQWLTLHFVRVHRDGRIIDNLTDQAVQVFQREPGMERHLYDGSETVVINQENIHSGDIIEYSYTLEGFNPIHQGAFFNQQYLQNVLPMQNLHIRLLADPGKPLYFHYLNGAPTVTTETRDSLVVYGWDVTEIPAFPLEGNTPPWFNPFSLAWISSFSKWEQVVAWALPHYQVDPADSAALEDLAPDISRADKLDDRILETIRFVQDEIRYLGMEQGLGAYQPNQPLGVYQRRFGDCKDKSLLLTALLRNLGVEAHPVLVNSLFHEQQDAMVPSPLAFDHVIVGFQYEGDYRYVDPTLSNQGGDLQHMAHPPYGRGLMIREGADDLVRLPDPGPHTTSIHYQFTVDELGEPVHLKVESVFSGREADRQRDYLVNNSIDGIGRNLLGFFSHHFPGISQANPISFRDENRAEDNTLILEEEYLLPDFWTHAESDSTQIYAELSPPDMIEIVDISATAGRTAPFFIGPKLDLTIQMVLDMPEDWPVSGDGTEINGDAFSYHSAIKGSGDKIQLTYKYKRLQNFVPAADTSEFIADHHRIWDDLGMFLSFNPNLEKYRLSGFAVAIFLATFLFGVFVARRVHLSYDPATEIPPPAHPGFGIWLVLLLLGLFGRVIVLLVSLVSIYFNHNTWLAVFSEEGFTAFSGFGTMLTFELLGHTLFLVFALLVIYQFFKKRSSFPRLMVILLISGLLFYILDYLGSLLLLEDSVSALDEGKIFAEIFSQIFGAMIWVPYLLKGKRPGKTFVNRLQTIPTDDQVQLAGLEPAESGGKEAPAPVAAPIAPSIRIVRWPATIVLTGLLQLLGLVVVGIAAIGELNSKPDLDAGESSTYWAGYYMGFWLLLAPPMVGAMSIFARQTWARKYNLALLILLLAALVIGGIGYIIMSQDPDAIYTLWGCLVMAVPVVALTIALWRSKAAKTFPASFVSGVPEESSGVGESTLPTADNPESAETEAPDVMGLFLKIQGDFPRIEMALHGPDSGSPPTLLISEQSGVSRRILMDLQKNDILNLSIGPVWLTWEACDQEAVLTDFHRTVSGLLSGEYRFVEYRRDEEIVMADILQPQGQEWVTVRQWSVGRWTSKRGLREEIVELVDRS